MNFEYANDDGASADLTVPLEGDLGHDVVGSLQSSEGKVYEIRPAVDGGDHFGEHIWMEMDIQAIEEVGDQMLTHSEDLDRY